MAELRRLVATLATDNANFREEITSIKNQHSSVKSDTYFLWFFRQCTRIAECKRCHKVENTSYHLKLRFSTNVTTFDNITSCLSLQVVSNLWVLQLFSVSKISLNLSYSGILATRLCFDAGSCGVLV